MNRRHASGSNLNAFSALRAERAPRETQRVRLCGGLMLAGGPRRAPVDRCRFGGLFARQRLPQVADQRRAAAGVHRSGRSERSPPALGQAGHEGISVLIALNFAQKFRALHTLLQGPYMACGAVQRVHRPLSITAPVYSTVSVVLRRLPTRPATLLLDLSKI